MRLPMLFFLLLLPVLPVLAQSPAQTDTAKTTVDKIVKDGDIAYALWKFDLAIEKYQQALKLAPSRTDLKEKIAAAEKERNEAKAKADDKAYRQAMEFARTAFQQGKYEASRLNCLDALKYKPDDPAATAALKNINQIISANLLAPPKDTLPPNVPFLNAVHAGDQALSEKKYAEALQHYLDANLLTADDDLLQQKINACTEKLSLIGAFQRVMGSADSAYAAGQYEAARNGYEKAGAIYPDEAWKAQQKASDCEELLKPPLDKKPEHAYQKALKAGQTALAKNKKEQAVQAFQKALSIKPKDPLARDGLKKAQELK